MASVKITHFSDILCIWAFASQVRIEELLREFEGTVQVDFKFFTVFGDVATKMKKNWEHRGGIEAYSAHVRTAADRFPHLSVHPDVWAANTPASSLPAHLYLEAVRMAEQREVVAPGSCLAMQERLRAAFFMEARNIAHSAVLDEQLEQLVLPVAELKASIASGEAFASLASDMQAAAELSVNVSPTLIFNEGRQRLIGNVGYKIIASNVRELLSDTPGGLSWC